MLLDTIRDAPAGRLVRLIFGPKVLPYPEEIEGFDLSLQLARAITHDEDAAQRELARVRSTTTDEAAVRRQLTPDAGGAVSSSDSETEAEKQEARENVKVGWYSPEDPSNPQNWTVMKKVSTYLQICMLTFAIYSGSSIITPADNIIRHKYSTSAQANLLTLSMYVLGYGTGPLFFSPISEIPSFGRNVPYIISLFLFMIMTVAGSQVTNYPGLVVCRFLQGFCGGPVLATGGASASDIFPFNKLPYGLAAWAAFAFGGPALGPPLSTYAIHELSYRWSFYITLIVSGMVFASMLFFLPETNPETILHWRAQRLRKLTGRTDLQSDSEMKATDVRVLQLMVKYIATPFKTIFNDPAIAFTNFYLALVYGIYYSWFESFPIVYGKIHGFSVNQTSLVFIANIIGGGIGCMSYVAVVYFFIEPYTIKNGVGVPERRLIPGLFASITIVIGIFIFAWTARHEISWVVPTIGVVIFSGSAFYILQCIFLYLPTSYPRHAASILTGNSFLRSAFATGAIHFSVPMFNNLGIGRGNSILGGLLGGCAILFFILTTYGPKLRARSKFTETH